MGELGALFNPGMRHELEERQAKAARREEEGNARDGDLRIDLESGVAVINVPGSDEDTDQSSADPKARPDQSSADPKAHPDQASADPSSSHQAAAAQASPHQASAAQAADDPVGADQAGRAAEPEPPVLRPRGKRGMSTAHR